ncbi:MAG: SufD family Fe-S cluster assembly protein [bacterium]
MITTTPQQIRTTEKDGITVFTIPENLQCPETLVLPLNPGNIKVEYEPNAHCDILYFYPGNTNVQQKIHIHFKGNGSNGRILGILSAKNNDTFRSEMTIHHEGKATSTNVLIKGIAQQNAKITISGLIRIEQGAKNTDTFFRGDILLLSPDAKAVIIPSLEIIENEVKGGHAATVSKLNPDQLFYLQTRGISPEEGKKLLIEGFLKTALQEITNSEQREYYENIVQTELLV